ncbi:MAG: preprotein translocase subunit YajC [Firmicutes bacterium]|nr:preprotein translocase subunit YajC [Bacillota bacterium]
MDLSMILLLVGAVVLVGGMMFFSSYKRKKYQNATMEMASKFAIGDKVKTIGGIIGEISAINLEEGTITVFTGDSNIVFDKQAVYAFGFFDANKQKLPNEKSDAVEPPNTEIEEDKKDENL